MNLQELRKEFGLPETSDVVPEHIKAVTTMQEALMLEAPSCIDKPKTKGYEYSSVLKKSIPLWIKEIIEETLPEIPRGTDKCFVEQPSTWLSACNANYNSRNVYDKQVNLINKHFNKIGINAAVCCGGSKRHPKLELVSNLQIVYTEQFRIGILSRNDRRTLSDTVVLSCNNLYEELYKLLYNYISECAAEHLYIVIPVKLLKYVSNYQLHRNIVLEKHKSIIRDAKSVVSDLQERIIVCEQYHNGIDNSLRIECSNPIVISWSYSTEITFDMKMGKSAYTYSDIDIKGSSVYLDEDLFYSLNSDVVAALCEFIYNIKVNSVKEYYNREHYTYRKYAKVRFSDITIHVKIRNHDSYRLTHDYKHKYTLNLKTKKFEEELKLPTGEAYIEYLKDLRKEAVDKYEKAKLAKVVYDSRDKHPDIIEWFD